MSYRLSAILWCSWEESVILNVPYTSTSAQSQIYDPQGLPFLQGWRDKKGAKLLLLCRESWKGIHYRPQLRSQVLWPAGLHYLWITQCGIPCTILLWWWWVPSQVKCLDDIKAGNFASWPGLTYQNAAKYFHSSHETIKVPMTQTRHNVRSTHPNPSHATQPSTKSNCLWKVFNKPPAKLQARPVSPPDLPAEVTNEVHSWEIPISNIYSDDTGCFPVRACSRNQYVVIFFIVTGTQSCRLCLKPRPTSIA